MSSIAIFPCTFTPGEEIVGELAKNLELEIYRDLDLIEEVTGQCDINRERLKNYMYGKTSVFNQFTLEREKIVNLFKASLAERLDDSRQYLFYGFLTSLIPARVTHVLKVLVVDTKQNRIDFAVNQGLDKRDAKKAVKTHDVSAYSWTDFLFQKEAYDSSLYDMVIPVESKGRAALIETITKGFHTTSVLQDTASRQAIADLRLETIAQGRLLDAGHKMTVRADDGNLTLIVDHNVLNYGKLVQELTELVSPIPGIKNVSVERSAKYRESIYRRQRFELPSKVLFVDDEKDFVETVSQRLISRDVGTYGVYNGEDALELITEDKPDVMVLDLKMPGLHGVEVLRRTKELAPDVEVIILTGHGTNEDMKQCMELGAFAYMNKPVDIEELSATIKAANEKVREREGDE
jgi:two-component system, OmpR family, response regulator CpxR